MHFVPLHVRTAYSFLQSGFTLENAFRHAYKLGYEGFGLTDVNTMSGFPELDRLSKKAKRTAIFGIDVPFDGGTISLYVIDEAGYRNMILISLEASQRELDTEFLISHANGLAIVFDAGASKIKDLIGDHKALADYLVRFEKNFRVCNIGLPYGPTFSELNDKVRAFAEEFPYRLLAFPHCLYATEDDAIALEIAYAIAENRTLAEKKSKGPNHFLTEEELNAFYKPEEISATVDFSKLPSFEFIQKRGELLRYPLPEGVDHDQYLKDRAYEGLAKKKPGYPKEYADRLEYELSVISKMGYSDYFLIVEDYVRWATENDISNGVRGSGAASLVAYALGIISADPIPGGLLFERFLNPERQTMPDIDVDFEDRKRDIVPQYLLRKYGMPNVAHILTFQTLAAKGAIRDVGRIFEIKERDVELLCKCISDPKKDLRDNYRANSFMQDLLKDPYYLEIISLASKIEGFPRQPGLHPVGIVLNETDLKNCVPVKIDPEVGYVVQYDVQEIENQGFLKMDLLALRNISIVKNCVTLVKEIEGVDLDISKVDVNDPEAIKTIRDDKVMGIFQIESQGMRNTIREMKPTSFSDIVALIALFRPGPMENIPAYSRRKNGLEKISYISPQIEEILKDTYGIIVYQEQIMMILQKLAGFSYGQADVFRRAISKKDASKMEGLKSQFFEGCKRVGTPNNIASKTYDLIYKFANYGFNKSHAYSYAQLTCQMAYLKAHYPLEFYASILDYAGAVGDPKFASIINEMKRSKIKLANPDVNESSWRFRIKDGKILFPLTGIKSIQKIFADDIIHERETNGSFKDFFDFTVRMKQYGLNQPMLVKLVDSGAFDALNPNRCSLRGTTFDAVNYAEMLYGPDGKQMLFDLNMPHPSYKEADDDLLENLAAEKEAIGMMLSGSPLSKFREQYGSEVGTIEDVVGSTKEVKFLAMVGSVKTHNTKKNTTMAFISLYDEDEMREFTLFQEAYDQAYPFLKKDKIVLVTARMDARREDSYIVEKVEDPAKE